MRLYTARYLGWGCTLSGTWHGVVHYQVSSMWWYTAKYLGMDWYTAMYRAWGGTLQVPAMEWYTARYLARGGTLPGT